MYKILSNQTLPILLYLIAALSGAWGQYFYKLGGLQMTTVPIYRNFPLFLGVFLFCIVMILFVAAFRLGGKMSVVYPVYATTFIWGTLIAVLIDKEPWSLTQSLGILVIIAGVSLIALGGDT